MLACIPTNSNTGLNDTVCDHFGSAPYFTLFDSSGAELKILENRNVNHSHGTCHPLRQLAGFKLDCIICSGMGRRAIEALHSEGIKIYQTKSKKVEEIIKEIKADDLTEIDPLKACSGHGQRTGFVHGSSSRNPQGMGCAHRDTKSDSATGD